MTKINKINIIKIYTLIKYMLIKKAHYLLHFELGNR